MTANKWECCAALEIGSRVVTRLSRRRASGLCVAEVIRTIQVISTSINVSWPSSYHVRLHLHNYAVVLWGYPLMELLSSTFSIVVMNNWLQALKDCHWCMQWAVRTCCHLLKALLLLFLADELMWMVAQVPVLWDGTLHWLNNRNRGRACTTRYQVDSQFPLLAQV